MDKAEVLMVEDNWRKDFGDCPNMHWINYWRVKRKRYTGYSQGQPRPTVTLLFHLPFPISHTVATGILL
jgi:hypothetical protein